MKLFATVLMLALTLSACGGDDNPTAPSPGSVAFSTTDVRVGTGAEAQSGRRVRVNYSGWLYSTAAADNKGTKFDSSYDPGRVPLEFTIGSGVITGFSQGVIGMRVGGYRRVVIPPNLGYGSQGSGNTIPPNATLIFEMELLSVQ
jgi:FKBP-type peptidyl-prolyl cis-trans isomerase FkpA